ncbi:uncharacterized protein FIBRA_02787 [Fibroporia radiculosa]|uniref:Uncharacterized protein n=1 Tax=Fibroporia radiculosa TaxID=599839 RepID=J4HVH7_9APHY|nr:uncharacterized protein FIBRA_02787 [Fibroporia radiculosa]CCM00747.1 predicted protein [Fibroporia radiculosa]
MLYIDVLVGLTPCAVPQSNLQYARDEDGNERVVNTPNTQLLRYVYGPLDAIDRLVFVQRADVTFREPFSGHTALHVAARVGSEQHALRLLEYGAPWNQIDNEDLTPGEVALNEGHEECYKVIYNFAIELEYRIWFNPALSYDSNPYLKGSLSNLSLRVSNEQYLKSSVTFRNPQSEIPDEVAMIYDDTGVMMEWERPLMKESARILCENMGKGKAILNIGFGLGIIDSYFQSYEPANHTIIEGHPQCLEYMRINGWYDKPNVRILEGSWRDFIGSRARKDIKWPTNGAGEKMEGLGTFDVIYFDTFNESYGGHLGFLQCLRGLVSGPSARFSFFHGHNHAWKMGYEVYTEVATMHANDFGFSTTWTEFGIDADTVWTEIKDGQIRRATRGEKQTLYNIPLSVLAPTVPKRVVNPVFAQ